MKTPPRIPERSIKVGQIVSGTYVLEEKLGAGGNGFVWSAFHQKLGNKVVLKFPNRDQSAQLQVESENLAQFSSRHPNIVNILDVGRHKGRPFLVLQHMQNGSLDKYTSGLGPDHDLALFLRQSGEWVKPIASALDFIHQNELVHQDVKPANILFDDSYSPYLSDFGLSKTAQTIEMSNSIAGSLPYMAPEVLAKGIASPASDQFSLAVTIYEFVSGRRPFSGSNAKERYESIKSLSEKVELHPDKVSGVGTPLTRALSFAPQQRFPNCKEFVEQLIASWPKSLLPKFRSKLQTSIDTHASSLTAGVSSNLRHSSQTTNSKRSISSCESKNMPPAIKRKDKGSKPPPIRRKK